jgi:dipeptidyl aminopeptidase/acylaminoacyl peptidase
MVTNDRYRASEEPPIGPDTAPRQNPVTDELVFIRQNMNGSTPTGSLVSIEDSSVPPFDPIDKLGDPYDALDLRWSNDGTLLLITTASTILYFDTEEKRIATLPVSVLRLPEAAADTHDAIAYTGFDEKNVAQIYIYDMNHEKSTQVTQNPDGTIRGLVWIGPA